MKNKNSVPLFKKAAFFLDKRSPEILMGLGIASLLSATIMAVKATPKALDILNEEDERRGADSCMNSSEYEPISKKETVKLCWKCYIPTMAATGVGIACLIGSGKKSGNRNAALATAYSLSESALREYRDKVVETIGEKKEQDIRDAVAKDKIERNPVEKSEVILSAKGDTLCYDAISGRYFKADIDSLKRAANDLNRRMLTEMCISLNDFYYEIGLDNIEVGDDLGWNVNDGLIDLSFSSQLATDGTPCLVLGYSLKPKYHYDR